MYVKIGDEYSDGELQLLSDLLSMLDCEIFRVQKMIDSSSAPESVGLTDRGEYFIGIGFTAVQQYLTDTLALTGVSKKKAFNLGPRYSHQLTFISVVNAAANWWKHSAEWLSSNRERADALHTKQVIADVTEMEEYALSNVLAELLGSPEISLSALLPNLMLWRSAIDHVRGISA